MSKSVGSNGDFGHSRSLEQHTDGAFDSSRSVVTLGEGVKLSTVELQP